MARSIAGSSSAPEQRSPSVRWRDAAVDFLANTHRQGGAPWLGFDQECAALGAPAFARGFFLHPAAGNTATAAVGITETVDAWSSVSPMGSRATHAGQQSRD